jgi:glycine/serine hydroxymethyltransferase
MGAAEMKVIASLIGRAIRDGESEQALAQIREEAHALTAQFPIYPEPAH